MDAKQQRLVHRIDQGGELRYPSTSEPSPKLTRKKDPILELQLAMATNSINHEYARIEFDESPARDRQEELLDYMDNCRSKYLAARDQLIQLSPLSVEQFEIDLAYQKRTTLQQYHA